MRPSLLQISDAATLAAIGAWGINCDIKASGVSLSERSQPPSTWSLTSKLFRPLMNPTRKTWDARVWMGVDASKSPPASKLQHDLVCSLLSFRRALIKEFVNGLFYCLQSNYLSSSIGNHLVIRLKVHSCQLFAPGGAGVINMVGIFP
ncbi:hypothetical protein B0H14DRAFT_3446516 [Mycena olivaceomarginata]|nr:hypothetical protein B0H14DRAFT_3446516 [Mycena olivaceomarginata]